MAKFMAKGARYVASDAFIKAKQEAIVYPEAKQVQHRGKSMGAGNTVFDRIARDGRVTYNRATGSVVTVTYEAAKYASTFKPRKLTADQQAQYDAHSERIENAAAQAMARWRKE